MLKEIAQAWRNGSLMKEVINELSDMIVDAQAVYNRAWDVCLGMARISEVETPLRDQDKQINRRERHIRRMLVEHTTLNPGQDIPGCFAVMTMAKDTERIGDLSKDIFRIGVMLDGKIRELKYADRLDHVRQEIVAEFPLLERAVRDSDDQATDQLFQVYESVKPEIKGLMNEILEDNDQPASHAGYSALLCHLLLRINAHCGNAASGVAFSVENIDFVKRGLRKKG